MKNKLTFTTIFSLFIMCYLHGQTYVGEVLYRNAYEYIKLECKDNICSFSIPYLDGDQKFETEVNFSQNGKWQVKRGIESWQFSTLENGEELKLNLKLPGTNQTLSMYKQLPPLSTSNLLDYEGVYQDNSGHRAIIYAANGYLHLMSPYSEESMSLKLIGIQKFWSVSGEHSSFSNQNELGFQKLIIRDRFGNTRQLDHIMDIKSEEKWIPIAGDTIYAKLFLPEATSKVPACLLLPGGGSTGIDNYVYEARLFAGHGIASLVFDKAGNGNSIGNGHFTQQSFEDKNDLYKQLFKYLVNQPNVDASKVGIHGPSEGGRLAMMMAIDLKKEIAFVNATAAPFMTLREGQLYAIDQHHRIRGLDEVDILGIQQVWNDYYDAIITGEIDPEIIDRANRYRAINSRLFLPPDFTEIPTSPRRDDLINERVVKEAGKINCPILLQYGENDQRVNRQKSLQNLYPMLPDDISIHTIIYKRGNHSFMTPEYRICRSYTEDKIKWLKTIGIL